MSLSQQLLITFFFEKKISFDLRPKTSYRFDRCLADSLSSFISSSYKTSGKPQRAASIAFWVFSSTVPAKGKRKRNDYLPVKG